MLALVIFCFCFYNDHHNKTITEFRQNPSEYLEACKNNSFLFDSELTDVCLGQVGELDDLTFEIIDNKQAFSVNQSEPENLLFSVLMILAYSIILVFSSIGNAVVVIVMSFGKASASLDISIYLVNLGIYI